MLNENKLITFHGGAKEKAQEIEDALSRVIDPELGIDLVNLGLIYEVSLDEAGMAVVLMTLTTAGCPLLDYLVNDVCYALIKVSGIEDVDVKITLEPEWTFDFLSPFARMALGIPDEV